MPTKLQRIAQIAFLPIEAWLTFCQFVDECVSDGTEFGRFWSLLFRTLFTLLYWAIALDITLMVVQAICKAVM